MFMSEFPTKQLAKLLGNNMQYAGENGQNEDAQIIYYFLVHKYDAFYAKEVLHFALEIFRKPPREVNQIVSKLEDKMNHI